MKVNIRPYFMESIDKIMRKKTLLEKSGLSGEALEINSSELFKIWDNEIGNYELLVEPIGPFYNVKIIVGGYSKEEVKEKLNYLKEKY